MKVSSVSHWDQKYHFKSEAACNFHTNLYLLPILQHLFLWKYWITGVVSAVVIALGCIGNLTAILLLQKPKMSTAFNQLLIVLCIFDTIFLISNIPTTELALQSRKLLLFSILRMYF